MFDMTKAFGICQTLDSMFKDCSREELLACLGMTIDFWAARNGEKPAELIAELQEVSADVNGMFGPAVV